MRRVLGTSSRSRRAPPRVVIVERIDPAAPMPRRATRGSAAFDLASSARIVLPAGRVVRVPTGLKMRAPPGTFLEVRPRSGLSCRGVMMANAPGTIDRDYAGEVFVPMVFLGPGRYRIERGDRIAQVRVVEELPTRFRAGRVPPVASRRGGFGSTGR
ncbi:MAG: dUTP diphosphatase [Thermoplasmata archaeon]